MPTSEHPIETSTNPLQPLDETIGWLASTTLHLAIGVFAGLILAHAMRRFHLRWTWAASATALVVLVHPALSGWATTLGAAAACAAVRARHWHAEDLLSGGDLAEIAADRRGPLDVVRALARGAALSLRASAPMRRLSDGHLILGRCRGGELVSMPLGDERGGKHTLIVGATGSGKTYTQTWILTNAIESGMGAVVIDPKGDARMRIELARAARANDRPLIEWTPRGPSVYNPLGHGPASAIADKALAGERFTEPHYQRQAQRYLGHAVRLLREAGVTVSLGALVEHLDPDRLEALARKLPERRARATYEYLDALSSRQRADLTGVRDRLAIMAESDVAPWLDPATSEAPTFDLFDAMSRGAVVYFSLESDSWPLLAHMLGVAILQDLQTAVAALQGRPVSAVVAIDEFSAISAEHVARLFGRARSAGVSLLLGTQELSDLRLPGRERLLEQVLGNLAALIAHQQVVPESAELIAKLAGTRGAWRSSRTSDGRWTRMRSSAPLLRAEAIRSLAPGAAAVVRLGGRSGAEIVQVFTAGSKHP
jgi:type IV secretory pathway TraG/TraD family ATPase VirD4